eukprot:2022972-Alexandrium_andersonii.AAC.1
MRVGQLPSRVCCWSAARPVGQSRQGPGHRRAVGEQPGEALTTAPFAGMLQLWRAQLAPPWQQA